MTARGFDVIVIGAGIIGVSLAWRLAQRGARVLLLERDRPGCEASTAAGGILAPQAEADSAGQLLELALASQAMYPAFCEELRETTGIDCEYRSEGLIYVCLTDADEERLEARCGWNPGLTLPAIRRLEAREVRSLEPMISPQIRWGLHFPTDHQVETLKLMSACVVAATGAGVELHCGEEVAEIVRHGDRVAGVRTSFQTYPSEAVVICAGAWSTQIGGAGMPDDLIQPARGQMVCVQSADIRLRHIVYSPRGYLVPRRDGRILAGSTVEMVGFARQTTLEGIATILRQSLEIAPGLGDCAFQEAWCGFRPRPRDELPVLGETDCQGLFVATGHFRNGILLAPVTAASMSGLILEQRAEALLEPFSPGRF